MKRILLVAVLLSWPGLVGANTLFFKPDLPVNRVSNTQFEVIEARGEGPNGIWCAAADYAARQLGKTSGRLYIAVPRGPSVTMPGRTGIIFSTQPIADVPGRATNSIREVGANLRVAHALQFCRDYIIELDDIL